MLADKHRAHPLIGLHFSLPSPVHLPNHEMRWSSQITPTRAFKPDCRTAATTRRQSLLSKFHDNVVGTRDVLQPTTLVQALVAPLL